MVILENWGHLNAATTQDQDYHLIYKIHDTRYTIHITKILNLMKVSSRTELWEIRSSKRKRLYCTNRNVDFEGLRMSG